MYLLIMVQSDTICAQESDSAYSYVHPKLCAYVPNNDEWSQYCKTENYITD